MAPDLMEGSGIMKSFGEIIQNQLVFGRLGIMNSSGDRNKNSLIYPRNFLAWALKMCLTKASLSVLRKVPNLPGPKGPSTQELSTLVLVNGSCSIGFGHVYD